jgi:adenosyl cobinamide kinase/adenosyl cobinamide phosphate guanylyltransferase
MQTKIIKIEADWKHVKNVSRTTVNKDHTDKEPTSQWKQKMLMSEHSPIREIIIKWQWKDIKSWVATHLSRHKWECYVSTQREDRTGEDRNSKRQDTPVTMDCTANAQHLINTARKRLCYQSHPETRDAFLQLKMALLSEEKELSDILVPNCIYRGICPEFKPCNAYKDILILDERYKIYNHRLQLRR